jgi:hypothetical protein
MQLSNGRLALCQLRAISRRRRVSRDTTFCGDIMILTLVLVVRGGTSLV